MLRLFVLTLATVFASASHASACFWDSDTVRTEREFKQNYEFKSGIESEGGSTPKSDGLTWSGAALALSGFGLMAGAVFVTTNFRKTGRADRPV